MECLLEVNGTYHYPLEHKTVANKYGIIAQVQFNSEVLEGGGVLKDIFVHTEVVESGIKVTEDMLQSMPFKLILKEPGLPAQEIDLGTHEMVKQEDRSLCKQSIKCYCPIACAAFFAFR